MVYVTITTVVSDYQPDIEEKEKLSMIQLSPRFWGMTLLTDEKENPREGQDGIVV